MRYITLVASIATLFINGCVMKEEVVQPTSQNIELSKQNQAAIQADTQTTTQQKSITIPQTQTIDTQKSEVARDKSQETIQAPLSAGADTITFPTLNGKVLRVNMSGLNMEFLDPEYQNKNVMIFMFGYDCPHCLREMATIRRLQNDPRLKIVGIHAKSMIGDERLRSFARSKGLNFDILSFKNDIKMIRFLREGGFFDDEVPTSILVHPDGTLEIVYPQKVLEKI
jgi:thiol-disulfide isomerase/thioredoxin